MEYPNEKAMEPPAYSQAPPQAPYASAPTGMPVAGQMPQAAPTFQQPVTQVFYGGGAPNQPQPPPQQVTYVTQTTSNPGAYASMQSAIPVMPMACAIVLCIVNVVLPGIGTIIASFTVFCCANLGQSGGGKFGTFCLNFWVGWLQILTLFIFLIGWVWSIMWGIAFISAAAAYGKRETVVTTATTVVNADQHVMVPQQQQYVAQQQNPQYPPVGYATQKP